MYSSLFFTNDFYAAKKEIRHLGGRVPHRCSSVIVANFNKYEASQNLKHASNGPQQELSEDEERFIQAWNRLQYEPHHAPGAPDIIRSLNSFEPKVPPTSPTSLFMKGEIALNLFIVSGTSSHELSEDEESKILQEVIEGADFLANAEPKAKITFRYYFNFLKVEYPGKGTSGDEYERLESPWRDAALKLINYGPGIAGIKQLIDDKIKHGSEWGYAAFFTSFPIQEFAYTKCGSQHLVIESKNGDWGVKRIHQIFAHETAHVFGAMDEYCKKPGSDRGGTLQIYNGNSIDCPSQVPCLMMKDVALTLCHHTQGQLGWVYNLPDDLKEQARERLEELEKLQALTIKNKFDIASAWTGISKYDKAVVLYNNIIKDPRCSEKDKQKAEKKIDRIPGIYQMISGIPGSTDSNITVPYTWP